MSNEAMCTQRTMPLLGRTMPRCPHPTPFQALHRTQALAADAACHITCTRRMCPSHEHRQNDATHAHTTRRQNNVTLMMMLCTHTRTQLMSCHLHLSQLASPLRLVAHTHPTKPSAHMDTHRSPLQAFQAHAHTDDVAPSTSPAHSLRDCRARFCVLCRLYCSRVYENIYIFSYQITKSEVEKYIISIRPAVGIPLKGYCHTARDLWAAGAVLTLYLWRVRCQGSRVRCWKFRPRGYP
jgi:hypothetical protein